jgi:hypothetical protein
VGEIAAGRLRDDAEALAADLAHEAARPVAKAPRLVADRVAAFFASARRTIATAGLAATLALRGVPELPPEDRAALAAAVAEQEGFLAQFHAAVLAGSQPPDGTLAARAEQYGRSAWAMAHRVDQAAAARAGRRQVRSQLGPADQSCPGCVAEAEKGWVDIGGLVPIGSRECKSSCRCSYLYR